jgi:hypothetical protein
MNATRNTLQLAVGDIVRTHGVRLRLAERREYGASHFPTTPADLLPVVSFSTEYAGPVSPDFDPIKAHGRYYGGEMVNGRWTVQGNRCATWAVEVNA